MFTRMLREEAAAMLDSAEKLTGLMAAELEQEEYFDCSRDLTRAFKVFAQSVHTSARCDGETGAPLEGAYA